MRSRRTKDVLETTNVSTSSTMTWNSTKDVVNTTEKSTSSDTTSNREDVSDTTNTSTSSNITWIRTDESEKPTNSQTGAAGHAHQLEEQNESVKEDGSKTIIRDYRNEKCSLEHFQENHWNCETHKFDHTCDTEALNKEIISSLNIGSIHFIGDSLTRNRYMTASLEFSGKLPINDTICPKDPRDLEHFIRNCRSFHCIHKRYNQEHEVPRNNYTSEKDSSTSPPSLKLYHNRAFYNMGEGGQVIQNAQPNDVIFLSVGPWIDYGIKFWTDKNRFKGALKKRPRRGEVIIWIALSHVGHLKPEEHLKKQNNPRVLAYNKFMQENYLEYNMDGYVDFFNITKFSDDCARDAPNATKEELMWANFDGTHSTAEPNRMMHVGLMLYLQQNLSRLRKNQENWTLPK